LKIFGLRNPAGLTKDGNMDTTDTFFALLRMKLCPDAVWDNRTVTEDELKQIYSLAKSHDLSQFVAAALSDLGILPEEETKKLKTILLHTMWRYEKLEYELKELSRALEDAGIDYMPLKGSVIRKYYPQPWMRTSGDIDFLVRAETIEQTAEVLAQELHYTRDKSECGHHISMHAPSGVHLEPHFNISENDPRMDPVLAEVWDNSDAEDAHRYRQSPEFLMFHIIAHMAHHFQNGGCGIRPFIDLYLLEDKLAFDRERMMDFCTRAGVAQFYECVRQVNGVWFDGKPHTDVTRRIEEYVLSGGVYGTKSNAIAVGNKKTGNKFVYILRRIFMPYHALKYKYPVLKKHPWLTPIFQVVRWVQMLLNKRLGTYTREFRAIQNLSDERLSEINLLLNDVGLA